MKRFLKMLHQKIKTKKQQWPDLIDDENYEAIRDFHDYDNRYTAPLHGFEDAVDYWKKCSSIHFIPGIRIPTLIVNALNDSFLEGDCYPYAKAQASKWVYLETPRSGGHVGFMDFPTRKTYWSEARSIEFVLGAEKD